MFPPKTPRSRTAEMVPAKVIVAVKAEKVMSKTTLAWALTHVVRSGDCITLLAVFPGEKSGNFSFTLNKIAFTPSIMFVCAPLGIV